MADSQPPELNILLLGSFEVSLAGRPVAGFESDKVRALLAYLATEAGAVHRRELLAGLLWPEMPEERSRMNLRGALADLRQLLEDRQRQPPWLQATRQTIRFVPGASAEVDVLDFGHLTAGGEIGRATVLDLEQAVELYRGPFLPGFALADSVEFEDWMLGHRRSFEQQQRGALARLAGFHEQQGAYRTAVRYADQQLGLDPLDEQANRNLIRLLALGGQRASALERYDRYRQALTTELGVEPSDETLDLVERVRSGAIRSEARAPTRRSVRGYDLKELVGEGSFGEVYRAYQPLVGREVAVKIVHPTLANQPEFIRRFEAEAQLVARVEHLHVAPLYDYWREPDGAYLVMRLFRAGSLKDSLASGPWELAPAQHLVDQIGAALAAAHRNGVVHRDVKPANILLDEAGNAYLSDFGIARELEPSARAPQTSGISGTLAYLAPEQLLGQPATPRSDIYSFGVVIYELLTGRQPFAGEDSNEVLSRLLNERLPSVRKFQPQLPAAIDHVLGQATAKEPADRFAGADELAAALRAAATGERRAAVVAKPRNPFKGLRPFQESDRADFYGRGQTVERLLARLGQDDRFLAVVGPSGSGKSSVVQAGLIPTLRNGRHPGADRWYTIVLRPGPDPQARFASALRQIAVEVPHGWTGAGSADAARLFGEALPEPGAELMIVIDQLEEVFTLVKDERQRTEFLESLAALVEEPSTPLHLIATLRTDLYDRLLQHARFGRLLRDRTEVVLPLTPEEMERAIVGPLERQGVVPDGELVTSMVAEVAGQPGGLPLLQFALTELFEQRRDGRLTIESLRALGGVTGALGRSAEALFETLPPAQQRLAKECLLRLVEVGEGTHDARRRVLQAELLDLGVEAEQVIERFTAHRMLTLDRDPETRAPTVELAHEALIRSWPRLNGWLDDSREALRMLRRLRQAAEQWRQAEREPSYLLRGVRLEGYASWPETAGFRLAQLEADYLQASREESRRRQELEGERQQRELALERRAARRLRGLAAVLAIGAAVSLTLAGLAERNAGLAAFEARAARGRELAALAQGSLAADPERAMLLAVEAASVTLDQDGYLLLEAEGALHQALQADRILLTLQPADGVAFSPDGALIASAGPDEHARLWDAEGGRLLQTLTGHTARVRRATFSPDGSRLVTTSEDGTARIWDLTTGEVRHELVGHQAGLLTPAWSPDGRTIVTTAFDGTARLWDAETGEPLQVLPHSGVTSGPDFSPDSARVAIADDAAQVVRIWEVGSGREVLTLVGHAEGVSEADFSPDGSRIATAGSDQTVKIWDAASGAELMTLTGHSGWVFAVGFSPDGSRILSGGEDGSVRLWAATDGRLLLSLAGHQSGVGKLDFSPDGTRAVTGSGDGTARVWDLRPEGSQDWLTLAGHSDLVLDLAFDPLGRSLATASWDGTARIWYPESGEPLAVLTGHTDQLGGIEFSPDGNLIATASYDGTVAIWSTETGVLVQRLPAAEEWVAGLELPPEEQAERAQQTWITGVAFDPTGELLATGGSGGLLLIWQVETGELLHRLSGHQDWVFRLAFAPEGAVLASAGWDSRVRLWNAASGDLLAELPPFEASVNSVAFSPDGQQLATAGWDSVIRIWEVEGVMGSGADPTPRELRAHTGIVWKVAFNSDGSLLATTGFDGTVKLWEVETGRLRLELSPPEAAAFGSVGISPDGRWIAAGGDSGLVPLFILSGDELVRLARTRLSRSWTEAECQQYNPSEGC